MTTVDSRPIARPGVAAPARWPMWAVLVAFGWSAFYVALGSYWVFGGAGFPFGRNDANGPDAGSLLAGLDRSTGAVIVVIVATLATVVAWLMLERQPAGWRRIVLASSGAAVVALLVGVVMDGRSITLLPPLGLFGWTLIEDWPTMNQLLVGVGACAWIAATAGFISSSADRGTTAVDRKRRVALRWVRIGRVASMAAIVCPLPYAAIRWSWALGHPIGAPRSFVDMLERNQPGVAAMEAVLATFACTGAMLTAGLYRPWGTTFPRWIPRVGRRTVPAWLPLGLGTSAAVAIFPFGRVAWHDIIGLHVSGTLDEHQAWGLDLSRPAFWGVGGLGWLFPVWSIALGLALVGYHQKRRLEHPTELTASLRRPRHLVVAIVVAGLAATLAIAALPSHGRTAGWITPFSPELPAPTGSHPVGVRDVRLVDPSRSDPFELGADHRELMVRIHYPAARPTDDGSLGDLALAPYLSEPIAQEWGAATSGALGLRADAVNWQFRTNSRSFAPVAPGRHPVVVVTPAPCQLRTSATYVAEELASHGYVVVAIDHTGEAPIVEFPGRHLERADVHQCDHHRFDRRRADVRAADIRFVVSHLGDLEAHMDATLDDDHVGLYGYVPLGHPGFVALASTHMLAAIAAVLPVSDEPDTGSATWAAETPTLIARASAQHDPMAQREVTRGWLAEVVLDADPAVAFADDAVYLPQVAARFRSVDAPSPAAPTDVLRRITRTFMDRHLTDRVVAGLDDGSRHRWPGARITVWTSAG